MGKETQVTFSDTQEAELGKENGMAAAREHADFKEPSWSDKAYGLLKTYILTHTYEVFMAEDVRKYAKDHGLQDAPSQRAWGAIVKRAVQEKLISFCGYEKTTNPKAHRTPAALWRPITKGR